MSNGDIVARRRARLNDWKPIFKFWKNEFDITVIHIYPKVILKLKAVLVKKRNYRSVIEFKGMNAHFGEIDVDINNCERIPQNSIELSRCKLDNYITFPIGHRDK